MMLDFYEQEVQLSDKSYTILIPKIGFNKTYVCEVDTDTFMLFGDESDLERLATIFTISSQEKDKIIYIPSKQNIVTTYLKERFGCPKSDDLVLLHHLLQFRTKDWKKVRRLLSRRNFVSYELNNNDEICYDGWEKFYYEENKDYLFLKRQFDSLFLVGSKKVFKYMVNDCSVVAENGAELFKWYRGMHEHSHLDRYIRYHGNGSDMTINFYDERLWTE